jgi:hypothetical protein
LKCDIKKFFASIDHAVLKRILVRHIHDVDTCALLTNIIDSFDTEGKQGVGLPLGNLTSQLLVNIYMNEFDQYVKHILKAKHYIRYADDFVFLSHSKDELELLLPRVQSFLEEKITLELHPNKVSIATLASGVDFLGWVHFPHHRALRTSTKKRMVRNVQGAKVGESGENTSPRIQAYLGLLKHGDAHELSQDIEKFCTTGLSVVQ